MVKRHARGLIVGLVLVAVCAAAAACSGGNGSDDHGSGEDGKRTVETGSPKTFCQSAAELASALATEFFTPGVPAEQAFAKTFEALDDVANSAPEAIRGDADSLRSALEKFYSSLDDVPAVGTPPDPSRQQQAQAGLQKTQEALTAAGTVRDRFTRFAEANCPGTTVPTITVPALPSS